MTKRLISLSQVPDDEADEVRALLEQQEIAFYETKPSPWGVSGGAIWISRDEDVEAAERLMAEYQHQRGMKARAEYRAAKRAGSAKTTWDAFRDHPLRAIGLLLGIAFLVAVLALPFLMLRN